MERAAVGKGRVAWRTSRLFQRANLIYPHRPDMRANRAARGGGGGVPCPDMVGSALSRAAHPHTGSNLAAPCLARYLIMPALRARHVLRRRSRRETNQSVSHLQITDKTTQDSTTDRRGVQTRAAMCGQALVCVQWDRLPYRSSVVVQGATEEHLRQNGKSHQLARTDKSQALADQREI